MIVMEWRLQTPKGSFINFPRRVNRLTDVRIRTENKEMHVIAAPTPPASVNSGRISVTIYAQFPRKSLLLRADLNRHVGMIRDGARDCHGNHG